MYGTTRFAIYDSIKDRLGPNPAPISLILAAGVSGFVGGIIGSPADIATVRIQSDTTLPLHLRRNYGNVLSAWCRIVGENENGVGALFRGVWVNAGRATITTTCQLSSYDNFKRVLVDTAGFHDDFATHVLSSLSAGLVATTCCNPVDVLRTQIMNAKEPKPLGTMIRANFNDHGMRWMMRGWVPSFARLGPQTIATFLILEQLRKLYRVLHAGE